MLKNEEYVINLYRRVLKEVSRHDERYGFDFSKVYGEIASNLVRSIVDLEIHRARNGVYPEMDR